MSGKRYDFAQFFTNGQQSQNGQRQSKQKGKAGKQNKNAAAQVKKQNQNRRFGS